MSTLTSDHATPFTDRRDLQYLEKLTSRVLAAVQTYGKADLATISAFVKADPKAVAEVLDVLHATPLISLERPRNTTQGNNIMYTYTHRLHGLQTINAGTFQQDYLSVLNQIHSTDQRVIALRQAITQKEAATEQEQQEQQEQQEAAEE